MKYPDLPAVDAVYTPNQLSGAQPNPFLEAMPEMLSKEALFRRLACSPPQPDAAQLKPSDRRRGLNALSSVFVPLDYMAVIYNTLFCAMESTYTASATIDSIRRVHAIHQGDGAALAQLPVATSTDSGSILGVPGIGKSSTIRRCLRQIPQVIRHSQYGDSSGDGVLLSYNYWKTGAYTQAKLSVTMTDELYEYVYTDGSAGPEAGDQIGAGESDTAGYLDNGIIFAVPVKRIDTNGSLYDESNFHAVYGTIHSGWTMMSDSIENKESVL